MSIYPYIILYRFDKYKEIDEEVLKINKKVYEKDILNQLINIILYF